MKENKEVTPSCILKFYIIKTCCMMKCNLIDEIIDIKQK